MNDGVESHQPPTPAQTVLWSLADDPHDDEWLQRCPSAVDEIPCLELGICEWNYTYVELLCTRPRDHDGPHAAHGSNEPLYLVWEDA